MNPFERHGIGVLSPSSINLYRAEPAYWCLRYLYGVKDEAGAYAWRGRAVEAGVDHLLFEGCTEDQAVEIAMRTFEDAARGDLDETINKERRAVAPMIVQAWQKLARFGRPDARQLKVECWIEGIEVPVIGYVDWKWPDRLFDLKTTMKMPSAPDPDHQSQVVIYKMATGLEPGLVYATPTKGIIHRYLAIDETAARRDVVLGARALRSLLMRSADAEEAASFFSPKIDDYHWSQETLAKAKEIWK